MQAVRHLTWWHTDVAQQQNIEQDALSGPGVQTKCAERFSIEYRILDRVEPKNWTG